MDISEESFILNLGIHIRKLRDKKNMSQQDLANDSGITKSQIARIERAEINTTVKTLIKIANALEIEPKELLNFNNKIYLTIKDNGKGFAYDPFQENEGIGLSNIRSRIQFLKGTVDFDSAPGKGTLVAIHVPHQVNV